MQRKERKLSRRVRNLVIICSLTAIILGVSTYAWFIGMRSVRVSSFDVEIAATESLSLSLDGVTWNDEVILSKATLNDVSYTNHTNSWGGRGLIPMSSIGEMDSTASRMKLFEKSSFTTTVGGYRLMASRVNNYNITNEILESEQNGYVVFDLFVRNYSGTQYLTALNEADEEAIFLTTDSKVTVAADGVANTGIENSVRVAFAQIGRVAGTTTTQSTITGITCSTLDSVTGICRTAQIWEPNDIKHVDGAISFYDTSCLAKTLSTTESRCKAACNLEDETAQNECLTACETETTTCEAACTGETQEACLTECRDPRINYSGTCNTIVDGTAYPTYAVNSAILSADNVDIYDGETYNGYDGATLLTPYPYFTDTMKNYHGTSRPTFMTLAPNSITKIRIYIYIEGQDIDNYDFASVGKKISVQFGFTKERFDPEDINYDGPYLPTTVGTCTDNEVPTTKATCEAARGVWTITGEPASPGDEAPGECNSNGTKEYCDLTEGTFVAHGTCSGGNVPTTLATCEEEAGSWDEEESICSGITETYCSNIEGNFIPQIKQSERQ